MGHVPRVDDGVLSWAPDLDEQTMAQARRTAALPFVEKPLALMADAHLGLGATVGSVIATEDAVVPAAVGVDIGCGMIAGRLNVTADQLPDDLGPLHREIARRVPAGIPDRKHRRQGSHASEQVIPSRVGGIPDYLDAKKVRRQHGTLGSGNHFVELTLDEQDRVWIVLHSGSRGGGNLVARHHIKIAKGLLRDHLARLDDPDLAHLAQGTRQFEAYIDDMHWAQRYALSNREAMLTAVLDAVQAVGVDAVLVDQINCHHNYTVRERHHGKELWVTRKGAIRAGRGDRGVIPGSMATGSFVVEGLGNPASYCSASHGAGRSRSRRAARRELTAASLDERMAGIAWNRDPDGLLDEHPEAYKDLGEVMANQADLVRPLHRLRTILNYKGA